MSSYFNIDHFLPTFPPFSHVLRGKGPDMRGDFILGVYGKVPRVLDVSAKEDMAKNKIDSDELVTTRLE